jgi:hypothetical protein
VPPLLGITSCGLYENGPRRLGTPIKRIVRYPGDRLFNESKIVVKQFLGSRTGIDRAPLPQIIANWI